LAFYCKRFEGLVIEVDLLVTRVTSGSLSPEEARASVAKVRSAVRDAQAVGDIDALVERLDAVEPVIAQRQSERRAERAARTAEAKQQKSALVEEAERVAAGDDWRNGATKLRDLLDQWKGLARLDRGADDELWRRFSAARTTYTRRRKQHYADLASRHDEARGTKEKIVAEAEALAGSTDWGPTSGAFRDLMSRWRAAGSAGRDQDDALWARFRAAQDQFFTARNATTNKLDEEYATNAAVKRDLLDQAEKLLPVQDPKSARAAFREIAAKWDAAGKVPRGDMRDLENRFKAIEASIRSAEDDTWSRTNPEVRARADETVRKLEATLEGLRTDLAAAEATGNDKKAADLRASIEARESWLEQARKSQS
jgi:Domain of Unknown Function (DUF349)